MKHVNDLSFRESVDVMFNRAVALMDLPAGLEEKIRVCNATYTEDLVFVCGEKSILLLVIGQFTQNTWNL